VIVLDALKVGALIFVAAIVQVSILADTVVFGGTPDLLLVTLVSVALVRGAIAGAAAGFFAGLVVDTAYLQTMGVTSLLLTVAGFWTGRYAETTGRDRFHAGPLAVGIVTVLYLTGTYAFHFILGDAPSARLVFVESLLPTVLLNLAIGPVVFWLVKHVLPPPAPTRAVEVVIG
jgi:rod shape-determining protein MreD